MIAALHAPRRDGTSYSTTASLIPGTHSCPMIITQDQCLIFLRRQCPSLWVDPDAVQALDLTVTVFDRFNGRLVVDQNGIADELAPTNAVHAPPLNNEAPTAFDQLQLYCHTSSDGAGWHYEWMSSTGVQ